MSNSERYDDSVEIINEVLFKLDPMHTGSVENQLYDEYYKIASGIAQSLSKGLNINVYWSSPSGHV